MPCWPASAGAGQESDRAWELDASEQRPGRQHHRGLTVTAWSQPPGRQTTAAPEAGLAGDVIWPARLDAPARLPPAGATSSFNCASQSQKDGLGQRRQA